MNPEQILALLALLADMRIQLQQVMNENTALKKELADNG